MFYLRRILLSFLFLLPVFLSAQTLSVTAFHVDTGATDAVKYKVKDANGNTCALVKIRLANYALFFNGDIVKSEYKGNNEYWVYMTSGASWIEIKSPVASPKTYNFPFAIERNNTYIMQLELSLYGKYKTTNNITPQELYVESFWQDASANDLSEKLINLNGKEYALLRVQLSSYALSFSGNDIYWVEQKWNEFWVYLSTDAKKIEINCPVAPPLVYTFKKKLKKGQTYILHLYPRETQNLPNIPESYSSNINITPPPITSTSYKKEEYKNSFYYFNYSTSKVGAKDAFFGNAFGQVKKWGWYGNIAFGVKTVDFIDTIDYYPSIDYYVTNFDRKSFWNYKFTAGPVYKVKDYIYLFSAIGYTFSNSDYISKGFTYEIGTVLFRFLMLSYMHIADNTLPYSAFGFGIGWAW